MDDNPPPSPTAQPWEALAQTYATSRQVSADLLVEWPAQLAMCGHITGKRVLDVGCGTGEKARFFAGHGARSVLGIDPSHAFSKNWDAHAHCPNLAFAIGDFQGLPGMPIVTAHKFDLIVSFQAIMYAPNLDLAVRSLSDLLAPSGTLVLSVPHPFRFAILKHEREGWGHGYAYRQTAPYTYPSPWNPGILLQHATPRVSDYLQALISAGLQIDAIDEPGVTESLRQLAPEKALWMDRYVGIIIFRAHAPS